MYYTDLIWTYYFSVADTTDQAHMFLLLLVLVVNAECNSSRYEWVYCGLTDVEVRVAYVGPLKTTSCCHPTLLPLSQTWFYLDELINVVGLINTLRETRLVPVMINLFISKSCNSQFKSSDRFVTVVFKMFLSDKWMYLQAAQLSSD